MKKYIYIPAGFGRLLRNATTLALSLTLTPNPNPAPPRRETMPDWSINFNTRKYEHNEYYLRIQNEKIHKRRPSTTSTTMNTAKDILSMALAAAVAIALYIIGAAF